MSIETNTKTRDLMIDVAFSLLDFVTICDLTLKEYDQLLSINSNKYVLYFYFQNFKLL